jgi:hypothetical protein
VTGQKTRHSGAVREVAVFKLLFILFVQLVKDAEDAGFSLASVLWGFVQAEVLQRTLTNSDKW